MALRYRAYAVLPLLLMASLVCQAKTVIVVASETSLYAEPGNNKKVLMKLARFTPASIKKPKGDWTQVSVEKRSGWVRSSALGSCCFISVATKKANCREGAGTKYSVCYNFAYGYPLQVVEKSGDWVKVKDWEGDGGWMHVSQLSTERFVIVRLPSPLRTAKRDGAGKASPKQANIRSGAGTENKIVFKAERGVVLKLVGESKGWLKVKHEDGDQGWIAANLVWGCLD